MKRSLFVQTEPEPALHTPTKGLNATVKNSIVFQQHFHSSSNLPSSLLLDQKLKREFVGKPQYLLENSTTYDNSLAKPNKVSKSVIKLNLLQSSGKKNAHSHSENKRKKFISVTQRGQQPKIYSSQKKPHPIQDNKNSQQQMPKINQLNQFSTIRQFLTPANTLKEYWSTMIQTLSNGGSKVEERQEAQENIMNEDVLPDHRYFCVADKARIQRKSMMNSLIFSQSHRKQKTRAYTEMEERPIMRREYVMTEPQCVVDSRNFTVFEQKIGQNTLTRKDSLILALIDQLDGRNDQIKEQPISNEDQVAMQTIPCVNTTKYEKLIRQQVESPQVQQSERKKTGPLKSNRIKCISLVQKQQSYKHRNSQNPLQLQGKFIQMKKKVSKKT